MAGVIVQPLHPLFYTVHALLAWPLHPLFYTQIKSMPEKDVSMPPRWMLRHDADMKRAYGSRAWTSHDGCRKRKMVGEGDVQDIGVDNNALCGIIYACFQEKATFISHGNTARLAKHHGDTALAKICGLVAADEKRHAAAYTNLMRKLFEVAPNESMLAFAHVMQARVTMPASRMFDGRDPHLFTHFSDVSQKIGVYTVGDYSEMLDFFLKEWDISDVVDGLSPEGRRAQEYVCGLPEVMRKLAERADDRRKKLVNVGEPRYIPFSWIFNKQVSV